MPVVVAPAVDARFVRYVAGCQPATVIDYRVEDADGDTRPNSNDDDSDGDGIRDIDEAGDRDCSTQPVDSSSSTASRGG